MVVDPLTAVGTAAAVAQLAGLAKDIVQRIIVFTKQSSKLNEYLRPIRDHVDIISFAAETIRDYLGEHQNDTALVDARVSGILPTIFAHCKAVDSLLDKYLPKEGDSLGTKVALALKSFQRDSTLRDHQESLSRDATNLNLVLSSLGLKTRTAAQGSVPWGHLQNRPRISNMPNTVVSHFVGRDDFLSRLEETLSSGDEIEDQRVAVLCGMGGQGKTQLALRYCQLMKQKKAYSGYFWVDASTEASTKQSFHALADLLKSESQTFDSPDARVAFVRSILRDWPLPWVLVCDNHDNPAVFPNLRDYFPDSIGGKIIVTSRSPHTKRYASDGLYMEVDGMTEGDAVDLLYRVSSAQRGDANESHAKEIVRRLGYLPLAIDQAGAYLHSTDNSISFEQFLPHYDNNKRRVLELIPPGWEYSRLDSSPEQKKIAQSAFTTWEISLQTLHERLDSGSVKAQILDVLPFFDEGDISEELFSSYFSGVVHNDGVPPWISIFIEGETWSQTRFGQVMGELKTLSLIYSLTRPEDADGFWHFSLHPLVRDWIELRQAGDKATANLSTSSVMLAATLLNYYRTQDDTGRVWCEESDPTWDRSWFLLSTSKKMIFSAHFDVWKENMLKHDSRIPVTVFERRQPSELVCTAAACLLFALDAKLVASDRIVLLSKLLWDSCDSDEGIVGRSKYQIGLWHTTALWNQERREDAFAWCRESRAYWSQSSAPMATKYAAYTSYFLGHILSWRHTVESRREARALFEQLRKEQLDAGSFLAYASTLDLAFVLGWGTSADRKQEVRLLEPFAGKGDPVSAWTSDDRRTRLSPHDWYVLLNFRESGNRQQLAQEWLSLAEERYGSDSRRTRDACYLLAATARDSGNTTEAIDILSALERRLRNTYPVPYEELSKCLCQLGRLQCKRGNHGQGRDLLNEAIHLCGRSSGGLRYWPEPLSLAALSLSFLQCGDVDSSRSTWSLVLTVSRDDATFDYGLVDYWERALHLSRQRDRVALEQAALIQDAAIGIFIFVVGVRNKTVVEAAPADVAKIFAAQATSLLKDTTLLWAEVGSHAGYEILIDRLWVSAKMAQFGRQQQSLLNGAILAFDARKDMNESVKQGFIKEISVLSTWIEQDQGLQIEYARWAHDSALRLFGEHDELEALCRETLEAVIRGDYLKPFLSKSTESRPENSGHWRRSWASKLSLRQIRVSLRNKGRPESVDATARTT